VAYGLPDPAQDPWLLRAANSVFYKVFDRFSYIRLPRNAGDFSLMEKRVVQSLLRFPERDLFIRGVRAFAGFKQVAVPYQRTPGSSRGLGRLWRSLGPAKRGILAFSTAPLSLLSFSGFSLFGLSVLLALSQVLIKLLDPSRIPSGITTTLITIIFFGSLNLLGLAVLGEYLATVFEEVKRRPHAIVSQVLKDGEQRAASMDTTGKGAA
jgi:dolichol-phosphate mannosyltransferase